MINSGDDLENEIKTFEDLLVWKKAETRYPPARRSPKDEGRKHRKHNVGWNSLNRVIILQMPNLKNWI